MRFKSAGHSANGYGLICMPIWLYMNGTRVPVVRSRSSRLLKILKFAPALKLHRWALLGAGAASRIPWPTDLPRPPRPKRIPYGHNEMMDLLDPSLINRFEGRVTRVFQRAIGWIILHEIYHLLSHHSSPADIPIDRRGYVSMLNEQEADHWASLSLQISVDGERMFDRWSLLGIVGAFTMLISAVLLPFNRRIEKRTHADPPTRLRRFLKTFQNHGDLGWTATSIFLEFELWAQQMPSAASEEFGTDGHLCKFFENIGGRVVVIR